MTMMGLHVALLVAAFSPLVAAFSVLPVARPWTARGIPRAATLSATLPPPPIDATIDELLAEQSAEKLPALLGRKLQVLTDAEFLSRLEARTASATGSFEIAQLQQLSELVIDFLDQVTTRLQEMEPGLLAEQAEADEIAARAAQAASTFQPLASGLPRRAKSTPPTATTDAAVAPCCGRAADEAPAPCCSGEADDASAPQQLDATQPDAATRETRAKNRFLLERLLDAAGVGVEKLDMLLRERRNDLTDAFFQHLQWEVDQQKAKQNRKLLGILEVVVQRACVEVESGQPEVALLTALLQTSNQLQRREMCEREIGRRADGPGVAKALVRLTTETQLELEKRVLRGEQVDGTLLQMLRVISVECAEYAVSAEEA